MAVFFNQVLILVLVALCGTGLGTAVASFYDNADAGMQVATPVFVLGLLFSGFYLSSRAMFAPLLAFEYVFCPLNGDCSGCLFVW